MRKVKAQTMKGMEVDALPNRPSVYFDTTTLPEAKKWQIGKTYELNLEVKLKGLAMRKDNSGAETGSADFEVVGIEPGEIVKKGGKKVARYTESNTAADEHEKVGE